MTVQEKFDGIIDCIEHLVDIGESDIPQMLSRETGMNLRLIGDAFQFIADMTLIKYIRQRRLVKALQKRFDFDLPIEQIVSTAGFSDAAAFSKACKNEFDMSPSQITQDVLANYVKLSFAQLTDGKDATKMENDTLITAKKKDSICGLSAEQFAEVKQVLEIGAVYGLDDEEAEFVYHLALHCKISTAQAADFYDDFKLQLENGSFLGGQSLFELAELACAYNLSFSESQSILYEIGCHGYDSIHALPDGFFDIYFSEYNEKYGGYDVPYICEILDALEENGLTTDSIPEILDYVMILGVDPIDLIENYDDYVSSYEESIKFPTEIPTDDTDGVGYRSVWEMDE